MEDYAAHSPVHNWIEFKMKFGNLTSDDFYTSLGNTTYEWITERDGGDLGRRLFPGGEMVAGNYYVINSGDIPNTRDRSFGLALAEEPSNLVGFNLSYYADHLIDSKGELDFKINKLTFTYLSE
ncbi:MAG: hypothetical protein IJR08_02890 [Bacilli bacterium]|nr:hypothetical protein [Bacilli bacterium]